MKQRTTQRRSKLGGLLAVMALGSLAMSTTMALFSDSKTSSTQEISAGTVTIGDGASDVTCNVNTLMPGDSSTAYGSGSADRTKCEFNLEYTGSGSAYIGVDVAITNGSTVLYSGTASGLQFKIRSGAVSFVNGTSYSAESTGASTTISAGTPVENMLLSTTAATNGTVIPVSIDYMLPLASPNSFQGGSVSVVLTVHAVQSSNQSIGSCVAGRPCSALAWS